MHFDPFYMTIIPAEPFESSEFCRPLAGQAKAPAPPKPSNLTD
jgi:hypothetical protein